MLILLGCLHPEIQDCVIHEIITRVLFYFRKDFEEKNIKIVTEFAPNDLVVMFDPQQLELVLINIIKNAIEAIADEGIITIKTTTNPVVLTIANNGEAIPPEIQKKLFEPFYTTKRTGQGNRFNLNSGDTNKSQSRFFIKDF